MAKTTNVFISHVHEDEKAVKEICKLLSSSGREVKSSSITSEKPNDAKNEQYVKSEILAPSIDWAGAVIVAISPNTSHSEWVEWEVAYAEKCEKTIVGVWLEGASEQDLPPAVKKYADALVGWDGKAIIDAIDGKTTKWFTPDGTPRPAQKIPRHKC